MKSILFFDYFATGEGFKTVIRFTNDSRKTDEMAIDELKSEYDEYLHCGFELYDVEEIKNNKTMLSILKDHVPVLYNYVTRAENVLTPYFRINYESYINYA